MQEGPVSLRSPKGFRRMGYYEWGPASANTDGIGYQWVVVGALLYEKAKVAGCGNEFPNEWLTQARMD